MGKGLYSHYRFKVVFFFYDWWKITLQLHNKQLCLTVACQHKGENCIDVGGHSFMTWVKQLHLVSCMCFQYCWALPTLPKLQCHNSVQCQLDRGRSVQQLFAKRSMVPMVWCYSWGSEDKHNVAREYPFWSGFKMSGLFCSTRHK